MNTLKEFEAAVQSLSPADRESFRAWFAEFDGEEWDRQFKDDVKAGRLDFLLAEARQDRQVGRCSESIA